MDASAYDLATKDLDPPLAIVDLSALDANADDLVRRAAGVPIRIASKSVRCRALVDRALERPEFRGILAYSLPEALWLFEKGCSDDIVVGYPTADHEALRRLAKDDAARAAITIMIDSTEHLDVVDSAVGRGHAEIRVCLELDVSWRPLPGVHVGSRRSPVFTPDRLAALARAVVDRPGFRVAGLMAYEGQIAGVPDGAPGVRGAVLRWMQRRSAAELTVRRKAAVEAVRAVTELEFVNGGGTGSLETTTADRSVTEVTAGSGLIGPTLFSSYTRFRPRPAAMFAVPVVRRPTPDIATVFSGGYIASGQAGPSRLPSPYLPAGLRLLKLEGAGEVQTPVVGDAAHDLRIGDRVWFRHAKAGELAERFTEYHLISGGLRERTVPTYRGEGVSFG